MGRYRGETPSKKVSRDFVWRQHHHILGRHFPETIHGFLASRVAGDAEALKEWGIAPLNIWAVERDRSESELLVRRNPPWRVWEDSIESVMESHGLGSPEAPRGVHSLYLDFCCNLEGATKTLKRVLPQLPAQSALSVTLLLGRELHHVQGSEREVGLLKRIREGTSHKVTLVQSIKYLSSDESTYGSPMMTWTFALGSIHTRSKMRFNLMPSVVDMGVLSKSKTAIATMWGNELRRSERQSLAAIKANQTRRVFPG